MGFIQSASFIDDASATSMAIAFGSNVVAGNLICVAAIHGGTTDQINPGGSLTDTRGTVYTERKFVSGQNISASVWSGLAASSGPNTVTAALAATQAFRRIAVHEVSGFDVFDAAAGLRNVPEPADSGSITPSVNGCYLFGAMTWDQGGDETIAAGTNVAWALRENFHGSPPNGPGATEDFIQPTAAAVKALFTEGGTLFNVMAFIMAFRAIAGVAVQTGRWSTN